MAGPGFTLEGKVALVTGASRGIGRAIALRLADAGARVIVSSRKLAACESVVEEIRQAGGEATAIACDVGKSEDVEALAAGAEAAFGRVDVLVLNAAVVAHFGPLAGLEDAALDRMLSANLRSQVMLCRRLVPPMAARGQGAVVIVGSTSGLVGEKALGGYALTKAADMQLVRNLAVEFGPHGVRANAVAPGLVRTDMTRAIWSNPERLAAVLRTTALGRMAEPEDIAAAVLFLASPAAACLTGQVLVVDAGMTVNVSTP
jgi:NAD(P)-dependent dehydrogenase (short-subunit alcohol dehydrogenase family)